MFMACFFPFLTLSVGSGSNQASLFDAIIAFSDAAHFPVPTLRLVLLIYVLGPLALNRPPLPNAIPIFRITEQLRPWCMVEIFVVGVAVSLVKIVGMADVELGPAFWAITILVPITVWKDTLICRWTLWSALQKA